MSEEKIKNISFCPGGRHYSSTLSIEGDVAKTGRKLLIGKCVKCNRKKSMFVNENTIQAETG